MFGLPVRFCDLPALSGPLLEEFPYLLQRGYGLHVRLEVGVNLGAQQLEQLFGGIELDDEEASALTAQQAALYDLPDSIIRCKCGPRNLRMRLSSSKRIVSRTSVVTWKRIFRYHLSPSVLQSEARQPRLLASNITMPRKEEGVKGSDGRFCKIRAF